MAAPVPDRLRKLIAINAFYHADQPDESITVLIEGDDMWSVVDFVIEHIAKYKRISLPVTEALQFLEHARSSQVDSGVDSGVKLMTMVTIGYLEEIGAIPTDNYNGMQYLYEPLVTTEFHQVEGPMPGLEMFRDLPRRPGNFYFILSWTDIDGEPCGRRIVRQISPGNMQDAYTQFQELLDERYTTNCETTGKTDKELYIASELPLIAERAVELLGRVTGEEEFRIDSPAGRLACFLGCWIAWTSYRDEINDSLLTLAFLIGFENGQFTPFMMADHGDNPQPSTRH